MRGLLIFDDRSDIAFYTLDRELEKYITDRIKELEANSGAPVSRREKAEGWLHKRVNRKASPQPYLFSHSLRSTIARGKCVDFGKGGLFLDAQFAASSFLM